MRKRLKEYYDGPGKNHTIQLSIFAGTYAPSFTRKAAEQVIPVAPEASANGSPIAPGHSPASPADAPAAVSPEPRHPRQVLIIALLAVAAVALTVAGIYFSRRQTASAKPPAAAQPSSPPAIAGDGAVRILAGYTGAPQTDSSGVAWGADRFDHGGGAWRRTDAPIFRTSDPFLFENWRTSDSSYDIPLRPGTYELHLYFVTADNSSEDVATFNVKINGAIALGGFNINTDALGANVADERVFRDVSPASDGKLHLAFSNESGTPQVNAIEVVPGLPHKTLPIRLVMQRTSYTDHDSRFWHADDYYMGGKMSERRQGIVGSPDPDLSSTERYGHFTYAIPVDTRDRYTLILHFVEFYFGPDAPGGGGKGGRLFKVMCNGNTLLDNFDIFKEAGSLHVLTKTFNHLKPSAQGKLNVTFEPIVNNATVSGIEVLDESQ